jgi:hypothetical protein
MPDLVYLLRVPDLHEVHVEVSSRLHLAEAPDYIRLATLAPLSNWGYPEGAEGAVLSIDDRGVVVGMAEDPSVPRAFVPWQNIAYVADGTLLWQTMQEQQVEQA